MLYLFHLNQSLSNTEFSSVGQAEYSVSDTIKALSSTSDMQIPKDLTMCCVNLLKIKGQSERQQTFIWDTK